MAQQSKKPTARKAPKYSSDSMALRYTFGLLLVAAGKALVGLLKIWYKVVEFLKVH